MKSLFVCLKVLKATKERQDNWTGVLHRIAQHPVEQVYLYTRCPCPFLPKQELEGQDTGCRAGRPMHPSEPPTPCSEGQFKCAGNDNFTASLSGVTDAGPANAKLTPGNQIGFFIGLGLL